MKKVVQISDALQKKLDKDSIRNLMFKYDLKPSQVKDMFEMIQAYRRSGKLD